MPNIYIVIKHESREIGDEFVEEVVLKTEDYDKALAVAKKVADDIADVYGKSYVTIEDEDGEVLETVEGEY